MGDVFCKLCGELAEWIDCWNGCDDGYINRYEEDPMWYDEDDEEVCDVCKGHEGWWGCVNPHCPPDAPVKHITYDLETVKSSDSGAGSGDSVETNPQSGV